MGKSTELHTLLCPAPPPLDTPHRPEQVTRRQREKSNHSGEIHRAEHPALPLVTSACTLSRQQASAPPSNRRSRTFQGNPQSDPRPCSAPVGLRSATRRQVALQQEKSNPGAKSNRFKSGRAGASSAPVVTPPVEKFRPFTRTVRHKRIFRILNDPMLKTNA